MKTKNLLRFFITIAIFCITSLASFSQGALIFDKAYDFQGDENPPDPYCQTTGIDWGTFVSQTNDGGFIVCGFTNLPGAIDPVNANGPLHQVYIVKTLADGTLDQLFNPGATGQFRKGEIKYFDSQYGAEIHQTMDGGYIVAATQFGSPGTTASLFKLNPDGGLDNSFGSGGIVNFGGNNPIGDTRTGYAAIQTPDGGYLLGGYIESGPNGSSDGYIIKLNATGNQLWEKFYGGAGGDLVSKIVPTADGGFVFAGITTVANKGDEAWIVKIDAAGNVQWQKSYGTNGSDRGRVIEQTADGGYIVGCTFQCMDCDQTSALKWQGDATVLRLDANGDLLSNFGTNGIFKAGRLESEDLAVFCKQTLDGGFVLASTRTKPNEQDEDFYIVRIDAEGNVLWDKYIGNNGPITTPPCTNTYAPCTATYHDECVFGLAFDQNDGGFILTGNNENGPGVQDPNHNNICLGNQNGDDLYLVKVGDNTQYVCQSSTYTGPSTLTSACFNYGGDDVIPVSSIRRIGNGGQVYINGNRGTGLNCSGSLPGGSPISVSLCCHLDINNGGLLQVGEGSLSGTLVIQQGSVVRVRGLLDVRTNGSGISVQQGGALIVENGGTLHIGTGGFLNIDEATTVIVENGGTLIYDAGAQVVLTGLTSVLEIGGTLNLQQNATFTFSGNGYLRFNSPLSPTSNNIIAGLNSKIILSGSGQTDKVLEIAQESMYAGSLSAGALTQFTITNGQVEMSQNSRLSVRCPLTLNNVKITSITGVYNAHRGVYIYGQPNVSINNTIFEYGKTGTYSLLSTNINPLTVTNSIFQKCERGLVSVGRGVTLIGCQFLNNTINGWQALGMNYTSKLTNSAITQTLNTGLVYYSGSTTGLILSNSTVANNATNAVNQSGIEYNGGGMLTIRCGSVSNNGTGGVKTRGILLSNNANLNMSSSMLPIGGIVTAVNNKLTIEAGSANMLYLNQGYNNMRPLAGGKVAVGGVRNSCWNFINAYGNQWKTSLQAPVQNVDYTLSTFGSCGVQPIMINDPNRMVAACISPPNPPNGKNASNSTQLDFCPNCPKVNTTSFNNVKLNDAVKQAMTQMEISNPSGNDLTAIDMLYQIMTYAFKEKDKDPAKQKEKEQNIIWLKDLSYTKMKEALGNAFFTGRTTDFSLGNTAVQQVLSVQDSIIAKSKTSGDGFVEFHTTNDRAYVYRLINLQEKTLELMDGISSCMPLDSTQNAFLSEGRKIVFSEYLVMNGEVPMEDFEKLLNENSFSYTSANGINIAGDTSSTPSGCVNQTVNFRPSIFAKTYQWNFGNGSTASTAAASTTYTATGTYTVTLITSTDCSADTFMQTVTIIDKPVANFTASTLSGSAPLQVDFANTSTGSGDIQYSWSFGDGTGDITASPSQTYQNAGTYTACLTASNQCGQDTQCVTINVQENPNAACVPVPNDIVSWWAGDGNANDIADGNDGTLENGASFGSGKVGQAFSLNGTGAYVNIPTAPNLNPTGSFSIEGWINSDLSAGTQTIALKWGDAGSQSNQRAYGLLALGTNGDMLFGISDDPNQLNGSFHTFITPPGVIQTNTWHHVAGVYDQTTGTRYVYVDGQEVAQRTDPPITITQSTTDLAIGAYIPDGTPASASFAFNGMIDEIALFSRVLTQSELYAIYNAGSAGKCKAGFARIQQTDHTNGATVSVVNPAFAIYPNPNNGNMTVSYTIPENQKGEFEIYNLIGVKVASYPLLSGETNSLLVSQTDLKEGVYLYRLTSNDKPVHQGKIVLIKQ